MVPHKYQCALSSRAGREMEQRLCSQEELSAVVLFLNMNGLTGHKIPDVEKYCMIELK